jgi:hypothetical protein
MRPVRKSGRCLAIAIILACAYVPIRAQSIDSAAVPANRSSVSIVDQIRDPAERAAFEKLLKTTNPQRTLALAREYLRAYPQSAFLATAEERAARASFDLNDLTTGLAYARDSLQILPENPLLLVAVADVQAQLKQDDAAVASARDALGYLDRFARPAAISARRWPGVQRGQQAAAWFAMGRALVDESFSAPAANRQPLLQQSISALRASCDLNPQDMEALYLLGVAYRSANHLPQAVQALANIDAQGAEYSRQAHEQLEAIYRSARAPGSISFDNFVLRMKQQASEAALPQFDKPSEPQMHQGAYAGSAACQRCHADVYHQWQQSGMARMLRPYRPENVIGDFSTNNTFYAGDTVSFQNGKPEMTPGPNRALFARMVLRNGRHFFQILQSDHVWHTYPVDYTIGSKWQQAYATRLPNGQIHVFPIQYNLAAKRWLNYWKVIDGDKSERADPYNWEKLDGSTNYMLNCATCHTSQLHNSRGEGFDEDNLAFREPGIDCEMCHGPSARHIRAVTAGNYFHNNPLDPPVDFHRITNHQFVAICSQCHMQSNLHQNGARGELNYSTVGNFFLPSTELPLEEYARGTFYKDGRFRQTTFIAEALERSQCFRKGRVSCGTCHNPHGPDEASNHTSLKFRDHPDLMCTGCHSQFRTQAAAAAHTHHPYQSEASRCVSCHMPRIMDAVLFQARSHQIDDIPNAAMTLRFGQQDSPNACLLCHTDKDPEWLQSRLQAWK